MTEIIKLPRSSLTPDMWRNGNVARLYLFLLSQVNNEGEASVSMRAMVKATGLTLQEVRTALGKLLSTQKITQRVTQKTTQITICDTAICARRATQKTTQRATQKTTRQFSPPTEDEVIAYVNEKNFHFNPESFIPYYEKQGWKQSNGTPIVSWQAACCYWESRWKEKHGEIFYYQLPVESTADNCMRRAQSRDKLRNLANGVISQSSSKLFDYYDGISQDSINSTN